MYTLTDPTPTDGAFPIQFEAGIPSPSRIPAPPDELEVHIRQYHQGLDRVTVKLWSGRKRYAQINCLRIGAKHGDTPKATVDQIARAVMAVCQDVVEERDQGFRFMVQCHVFTKPTGDAVRKAVHIELGELDASGNWTAEGVESPETTDSMLLTHLRECHVHILNQSKIIQEIGKEAIANTGQVFQARAEALEHQAAAQATVLDHRAQERSEQSREARIDRVVGTLEKIAPLMLAHVMNGGVSKEQVHQLVPDMVKQIGGGSPLGNAAMVAAPAAPAAGPAAVPSWAQRFAPVAQQQQQSPPPPPPAAAAPVAEPGVAPPGLPPHGSAAQPPAPEPEDSGPDANQHPVASLAHTLFHSLEPDQWGSLIDVLTKAQLQDLRKCGEVQEDEETCRILVRFGAKMRAEQQVALLQTLTPQQMSWVMKLRSVAEVWAEAKAQEDAEAPPEPAN